MKKVNKLLPFVVLASGSLCLTGCIEETFPYGSTATEEQVQESPSATEALVMGIPAKSISVWDESTHAFFGYPANMIIRDMMTGDYCQNGGGLPYGVHFYNWSRNKGMDENKLNTQFIWNFHTGFLLSINNVISAVDPSNATEAQLGYRASALAYRALVYLDLARMYEFLPNDKFTKNADGNDVTGLTVPWVTSETTPEEAANNPRLPRAEMFAKILADLDEALANIDKLPSTMGGTLPDKSVALGLKARLYMWVEDYPKAEEFARKAIEAAKVDPYTEDRALSVTNGYNTASDFMLSAQQTAESRCVTSGIINYISWVSNQTTFGYTGPGADLYICIDKNMYERISDTDWRKKQWLAPENSLLYGSEKLVSIKGDDLRNYLPDYASIKFRPNEGNGDDYKTGAVTAIPYMRVEEMYFIEAEAAAHQDVARGATLINSFMTQYRDPYYNCTLSDQDALVEEIVFQKRVELWGEGQTFFDIKRLDMSVTRGYPGTNWQDIQARLNTNGRPAWTNYVIVVTESNNNEALRGQNNPDPTDCYDPWTE